MVRHSVRIVKCEMKGRTLSVISGPNECHINTDFTQNRYFDAVCSTLLGPGPCSDLDPCPQQRDEARSQSARQLAQLLINKYFYSYPGISIRIRNRHRSHTHHHREPSFPPWL